MLELGVSWESISKLTFPQTVTFENVRLGDFRDIILHDSSSPILLVFGKFGSAWDDRFGYLSDRLECLVFAGVGLLRYAVESWDCGDAVFL